MKKIVSFLAVITMMGGCVMGSVGCTNKRGGDTSGKPVTGTTGAKIALARERLDESVFSEKMNFWGEQTSAVEVQSTNTAKSGAARMAAKRMSAPLSSGEGWVLEDGKVRWNKFGGNFSTMENFSNVFEDIEMSAAVVAESIGNIKKYVGVTDKWIGGNQLLLVDESRETLVEKFTFDDPSSSGYQVAHRYTREDAKNIYDIYHTWNERGESGETRMKYIPGEYYESSYVHSSGFTDYFMAEKSSGYWKLSRFGDVRVDARSRNVYIENYVVKDGVGMGILYSNYEIDTGETYESFHYDFFDTATGAAFFRAIEGDQHYVVSTYLANVKSGLAYVEADEADVRFDGDVCMNQIGMAGRLVFDGDRPAQNTDDVHLNGVDVGYDYGYEKYHGMADMGVNADSLLHALQKTDDYWTDNGATLKTNLSSLSEAVTYVQSLAASFKYTFEWNGYKVASFEGMKKGQAVLEDFFAGSKAVYDEVKNYESVESRMEEISVAAFANIDVLDTAQSTYANGKITLNNATLTISDTTFLEVGSEYVVKIALALKHNGGFQSVNMVALDTAQESKVAFAEGATGLTVTQSGEYTVPANLSEGEYAVVAYLATADEGIRVTGLKEVAFGEVTDGEVFSTAMKVDVKKVDDGLMVHYGVKLNVQAEIRAQASYTAEDIEKALTRAVVTYGYPKTGEVVTTEDGEPITAETVIESGTYKVKFFIHTEDGMAEAYAYLTIE